MATIAAFWVRKLVDVVAADGVNTDELLRAAGIDPDRLGRAEPVEEVQHYDLWERARERVRDPDSLPIRLAKSMDLDEYGALGLAWKTAPTLRVALERTARYHHVNTDTSAIELVEIEGGVRAIFHRPGARRPGMRAANEAALAEFIQAMGALTGSHLKAMGVYFLHPRPADTSAHEAWFGGPIHWQADFDAIELDAHCLSLAPSHADPGLFGLVERELQAASDAVARDNPADLLAQMHQALVASLPDGPPKMGDVARRLGMSERTLHRRLETAGTTYKTLLEETRRALVEDLLSDTTHPLGEIAFLAGFSEPSSFHRAFKRWTGQTPSAFRAAQTG